MGEVLEFKRKRKEEKITFDLRSYHLLYSFYCDIDGKLMIKETWRIVGPNGYFEY